ncbi:MAG: hypothetical protein Fur006_24920 [Coleofasciculaceae cyanobacterium]
MTQELIDLRASILEGRYEDALALVDELEGMSKKAILRAIKSFVVRILIHLIKNQVEQRLTNSWAASIRDSLLEIQDLNLKENKTSYYLKLDDWQPLLDSVLEAAIRTASVEVQGGVYSPFQLSDIVDRIQIVEIAQSLLTLTYEHSAELLPAIIDEKLAQLPGGEDWKEGR